MSLTFLSAGLIFAASDKPQWLENPALTNKLLPSIGETLLMVGWSGLFTVILGLPLGLLLASSAAGGLKPLPVVNQVVGVIVNVFRSFPFIILILVIMNLTRFLVGTSLGWKAAVVPLTVGAIPFFARLVEGNVVGVAKGKIEAAQMMGASNFRIEWGIQVREALPGIVQSVTLLLITLVGYSAMAGVIGGGGLGSMALNYGYQQHQDDVLWTTVIIIIVLVQMMQMLGDMISRLVDHR